MSPREAEKVTLCNCAGTPWQPEFGGWAFNLPRGMDCLNKWNSIPSDTDILVSMSYTFLSIPIGMLKF